jgi:DNA-binding NtrC family response regulator
VNRTPKSIVLLDDEKSYTELISQLLADNLDCPVHAFTRPLDALRALPALDVGVIATDYHMPQLDGIEFIREATPLVPQAVFVIITGHNLAAEEEKLARLAALRSVLPKPFGWRKLADEIIRVWPEPATVPALRPDAAAR